MYSNSYFLFGFADEYKKTTLKSNFKNFEKNPLLPWPPKTTFPVFFKFGSRSISLLFILDYTKRKLLHVNFKVVDSQEKKNFLCMPALTFILSSKSIWIGWNNAILFFIPNFKVINCRERQKIERGICHGIKRGFFCRKIFPSAHQYVFSIP